MQQSVLQYPLALQQPWPTTPLTQRSRSDLRSVPAVLNGGRTARPRGTHWAATAVWPVRVRARVPPATPTAAQSTTWTRASRLVRALYRRSAVALHTSRRISGSSSRRSHLAIIWAQHRTRRTMRWARLTLAQLQLQTLQTEQLARTIRSNVNLIIRIRVRVRVILLQALLVHGESNRPGVTFRYLLRQPQTLHQLRRALVHSHPIERVLLVSCCNQTGVLQAVTQGWRTTAIAALELLFCHQRQLIDYAEYIVANWTHRHIKVPLLYSIK